MADPNDVIASIISSMASGQAPPAQDPSGLNPVASMGPPDQSGAGPNAGADPGALGSLVSSMTGGQGAPQPDPNMGAVQNQPDPQAMASLMARNGPPPMVQGGRPAPNPNAPPVPPSYKGRMPLAVRALQQFIHPASGTVAGERVPSRTNVMEGFLGELMGNFSAGLAAAGHGPGANLRGAAGAMQAPYNRDMQDFQQQQQATQEQANLKQQGAQTQATQVGTQGAELNQEMIRRRMAMMGGTDAQNVIGNLGKLSDDEQAVIQSGRLESNMKGDMAPLMAAVKQVTNNRAISGREGTGVVEQNADSPTGYSKVFYDKTGKNRVRVENNVPPPAGAIGKTTVTQRLVPDKDGNIQAIPITTTSTPNLPGKGKGTQAGVPGAQSQNQGGGPKVIQGTQVMGADGEPLHKDMSQSAKTTVGQISAALHLSDRIQPDIESAVADMNRGGNLMDAAKVRSAWAQYLKLGIDPSNVDPDSIVAKMPTVDPRIARILPTIAMLQIVGAQPYLKNIRRFEFIKQVQQHIPDPEKDTPQLMLSKLQQLNRNLPLMLAATYKGEGITPKMDREMGERYMRLAGDDHNKARLLARQDGWKF